MPRVSRPVAPTSAATWLTLAWLASPALPVGGFSYSEGLEPAVEAGHVSDEASARTWLLDQLHMSLGHSDLPVVGKALGAWRRRDAESVTELNAWIDTTRETRELRQQTQQMGRSLLEWLRNRTPDDPRLKQLAALSPAPTWPIAFALAAEQAAATPREAGLAFAFGWAENMVQAALKAVPLGQSAGQRVLAALVDAIPPAVDAALRLSEGRRQAFTPMLAILSAQHEAQYSRLFRS
ncbi:MAG: urease accessory protein UreF [Methylibium sp.]|uniref:urease accessory protein UreF n=1 Tax=Methylibium sp. TaxID=2067992 RepID=UPI0017960DA0|nr:urease accessory protein UreF [Methylibium sp.]MBA3598691.1 urease accessory protein UreF [Methylibium sp.]